LRALETQLSEDERAVLWTVFDAGVQNLTLSAADEGQRTPLGARIQGDDSEMSKSLPGKVDRRVDVDPDATSSD